MDSSKSRWKSNLVCHRYNTLQNLKRANEMRAELLANTKSLDSIRWRDFQEYMITNLKLQVSTLGISIALLSTLGGLKILSNQSDLLLGFQ